MVSIVFVLKIVRLEDCALHPNAFFGLASSRARGLSGLATGTRLDTCTRQPSFSLPELLHLPDSNPGWGHMITGLELQDPNQGEVLTPELSIWLRGAVLENRLVVLRNPNGGVASPETHAETLVALATAIGGGYGVEDGLLLNGKSGHRSIFRVSNDPTQGATGVGLNGWHVDGTHKLKPQLMHLFHCVAGIPGADTWFIPLDELYSVQVASLQERWSSLWFRTGRGIVHPFVHRHPVTNRPALCLFIGSHICSFIRPHHASMHATVADAVKHGHYDNVDMDEVHTEVMEAIAANPKIIYKHRWEDGDTLIHDNLAIAHMAQPGSQARPEQAGLRILDRVSVNSPGPLTSDSGTSFIDMVERRSYLSRLWHSPIRHQMDALQTKQLLTECHSVGLDVA